MRLHRQRKQTIKLQMKLLVFFKIAYHLNVFFVY